MSQHCKHSSTAKTCAILHICYWHEANAMKFLIMDLHKEIIVPAGVQLAMRQDLCILLLQMLQFNSS
jgi:hypothetical protein